MKWLILSAIFGLTGSIFGLYLTYLTLQHIAATELMWFVFIVYIPFFLLFQLASKIADWEEKEAK